MNKITRNILGWELEDKKNLLEALISPVSGTWTLTEIERSQEEIKTLRQQIKDLEEDLKEEIK